LLIYLGKCIGLEAVPEVIEMRNPLLIFSEGFGNNENWEGTNMLLFEVKKGKKLNVKCSATI